MPCLPVILAADVGHASVLLSLFLILISAKLLAELFERLKQPAVVGEILAGVVIGPSLLGLVQPSDLLSIIAEIGVIFLLFTVGLETKPQSIFQVGKKALTVGVLGVIVPFIAGYLIASIWGGSFIEAMFIGAALVATSVGITARVLGAMGLLDRETSRIILGAAVIDDILGLIILSVVSSIGTAGVDVISLLKTGRPGYPVHGGCWTFRLCGGHPARTQDREPLCQQALLQSGTDPLFRLIGGVGLFRRGRDHRSVPGRIGLSEQPKTSQDVRMTSGSRILVPSFRDLG